MTCEASKVWSGTKLNCQEKQCPPPPTAENATVQATSSDVDAVATMACRYGYRQVGGDSQLTCGHDEVWHGALIECEEIDCGVPPTIAGTNREISGRGVDAKAIYSCPVGYRQTGGDALISCTDTGTWTTPSIQCTVVSCGPAPAVPSTDVSQQGETYQAPANYSCVAGYTHVGGSTHTTCMHTGLWEPVNITCQPVDCGNLTTANATVTELTSTLFRGSTTLACATGYEYASGALVRDCEADGTWSGQPLVCKDIVCDPPVVPEYSYIVQSANKSQYLYGETVTFGCMEHFYLLSGNYTVQCGDRRQWYGDPPVCTEIFCPSTLNVTDRNVTYEVSSTRIHAVVTFACPAEDTYLLGGPNVTCSAQGQWVGVIPTCEVYDCGPPVVRPHTATSTFPTANSTTYGAVVTSTCQHAYREAGGDRSLTCSEGGVWTGVPLECTPIECPFPPQIRHGSMHVSTLTVGSTVTYTCTHMYVLSGGNDTHTCGMDATWDGEMPSCQRVKCGRPPKVANATTTVDHEADGMYVTYVCRLGYTYVGGFDRKNCSANGNWVGDDIVCEVDEAGAEAFLEIYIPPEEEPKTPAAKQMKAMGFVEADKPPVTIATGSILGGSLLALTVAIFVILDLSMISRELRLLRKGIKALKRFFTRT